MLQSAFSHIKTNNLTSQQKALNKASSLSDSMTDHQGREKPKKCFGKISSSIQTMTSI